MNTDIYIPKNNLGHHLDNVDVHVCNTGESGLLVNIYAITSNIVDGVPLEETGDLLYSWIFTGPDLPALNFERSLKNLDDAFEEHNVAPFWQTEIRQVAEYGLGRIRTPQQEVTDAHFALNEAVHYLLKTVVEDVPEAMEEFRIADSKDYIEELRCGGLIDDLCADHIPSNPDHQHAAKRALHALLDYFTVAVSA